MANEINIQATLTVQRFSPAMQGSGSLNINQTGMHCIGNVQNIGTAAEALSFGTVRLWVICLLRIWTLRTTCNSGLIQASLRSSPSSDPASFASCQAIKTRSMPKRIRRRSMCWSALRRCSHRSQ